MPEDHAWRRLSKDVIIDHHLAIHDNVRDALSELLGLTMCRRGFHSVRIKHDDICLRTVSQDTSIS